LRYAVLEPLLLKHGMILQLKPLFFILLIMATVFIAAAGYAINDYFDIQIDRINKPDKVVIDSKIERKKAILFHFSLSVCGVLIGFLVAYKALFPQLAIIFPVAAILMWFYSTHFKKQFLMGNFIVALHTALVAAMVFLVEYRLIEQTYHLNIIKSDIHLEIVEYFIAFTFYAFWVTLIREIIKDSEDVVGDEHFHCNTIPIVLGIRKTKSILHVLIAIMISSLGYIQYQKLAWNDYISFYYILVFLQIPLLYLTYVLAKANSKKHFNIASNYTKLIILFGICYSFIVYYLY
jgi:4-hydroxybenzoate polyprenyltransferase